jgi:hypothetical protein
MDNMHGEARDYVARWFCPTTYLSLPAGRSCEKLSTAKSQGENEQSKEGMLTEQVTSCKGTAF